MSGNISLHKPKWTDAEGAEQTSPHWHFVIHFAGKRYRGTTKQRKKTLAQAFAEDELRRIERSYAGLPAESTPDQRIRKVAEALSDFEIVYAANRRPRAVQLVQERSKPLKAKLGGCLLAEITSPKLAEYIQSRKAAGVGPRTINLEVSVLARALGHTRRELWPDLKPLREPKDIGRALNDDEVDRLMAAAAENASPYIRLALTFALTTAMRAGEMTNLRWRQIDFHRKVIRVGEAKTAHGEGREVPLIADLRAALEVYAAQYARWFGELKPDWYLFPFANRRRPVDPARPVRGLKVAWASICKKAKVRARWHDLRHTAASRMGRAGASRAAMMKILGHGCARLVDHYCHAERRDIIAAAEALSLRKVIPDCQSGRQSEQKSASGGFDKSLGIN